MSFEIGPISPTSEPGRHPARRARRAGFRWTWRARLPPGPMRTAPSFICRAPPPEVLDAGRRRLRARRRARGPQPRAALRPRTRPPAASSSQVRDLEGNVIRTIPPPRPSTSWPGRSSSPWPSLALCGLASGVDTSSIVDQLMQIERQSLTRMQLRQTQVTARETGAQGRASKLSALKTAAQALRSPRTWAASRPSSPPTRPVGVSAHRRRRHRRPHAPGHRARDLGAAHLRLHRRHRRHADAHVDRDAATTIDHGRRERDDRSRSPPRSTATPTCPSYAAVVMGDADEQLVLSSRTTARGGDFTVHGRRAGRGATYAKPDHGLDAPTSSTAATVLTSHDERASRTRSRGCASRSRASPRRPRRSTSASRRSTRTPSRRRSHSFVDRLQRGRRPSPARRRPRSPSRPRRRGRRAQGPALRRHGPQRRCSTRCAAR